MAHIAYTGFVVCVSKALPHPNLNQRDVYVLQNIPFQETVIRSFEGK